VAAILGYRHGDVCQVESTVYSPAHARFSPGAVLLHFAVEDLIGRGVRLIDFGVGNPAYGHSSVLSAREEASVLLWRKTLANRARRAAHTGFRASTAYLRRAAFGIGLWGRPAQGCRPA
jgi:CelD/BcsL family acetyltransferase involved in cellulose biosynthesis